MAPASLLHRIEIHNFKAFREFSLDLEGRHLLVYGPNGSGKSSLYWALYTFLQSGRKTSIAKYFDPGSPERLLNIHEDAGTVPGEIALTLRDTQTKNDTTYRISHDTHGTKYQPVITKGEMASDFITYRFFFGFSHFRNSQQFNLWPLFEREILPFCVSTSNKNPKDCWDNIKSGDPNPGRIGGFTATDYYDEFKERTNEFAGILGSIVDSISARAQRFYDDHFSSGDAAKVKLRLAVTKPPSFTGTTRADAKFEIPMIEFGVQVDGQSINRPQSFLNEAKLTQLALSIRFAASLVNLHQSSLKLLVLDDLLVSLDMSNRMKVVELLHSPEFSGYQKIILTHEIGLFQELRRHIGAEHHDWQYAKLSGDAKASPQLNVVKTELEIAEDFLANDQLAECGNRLRKCAEQILEEFLVAASQKNAHAAVIERGKFHSLASKISEARGLLLLQAKKEFAALIQGEYSTEEFKLLLSEERIDPTKVIAANNQEKGRIIAKLVGARTNLQESMLELLSDAAREQRNAAQLLDEVKKIKDRILNPASHAGVTPLYTKEAEDAVEIVRQLRTALASALATL
ncbi:RecF/RecN/SMC N terminal domain-containing protein [Neorhodopirellula lusitana]|uniref:RecF/RecN/SMC N terminal domain-containing protein n=1 Tax=Neorhodopirellula lusitana TaxID=445327 RepID=A0ABY1Q9H0_9BACT|nr:ATP-binding protein [Neorhodopirellula lusitana]SMP64257.1 RecF/RecN/SMC N terminal domain-containing protein [Neorhodopirellula lusitana]